MFGESQYEILDYCFLGAFLLGFALEVLVVVYRQIVSICQVMLKVKRLCCPNKVKDTHRGLGGEVMVQSLFGRRTFAQPALLVTDDREPSNRVKKDSEQPVNTIEIRGRGLKGTQVSNVSFISHRSTWTTCKRTEIKGSNDANNISNTEALSIPTMRQSVLRSPFGNNAG